MNVQISSFSDYQELCRCLDRIKYDALNKDLQQARKRAEYWYKNGDPKLGAQMLATASAFFELEKFCIDSQDKEEIL